MLTPPETTTMAPRGKRCSRCLCCDAIIVFEGEALCAACDDGTHPALPERHNKFESDSANCPAQKEGEATPTGSIARAATSSKPSNPQPFKEEPMQRLTDEMRQAIREASASESCASIAKRLGMKEATVWWHRDKYPTRRRARSRSVKGMDAGAQLVEGSVQ
jgi:DNA-binding CsgD family transcriptional regulator